MRRSPLSAAVLSVVAGLSIGAVALPAGVASAQPAKGVSPANPEIVREGSGERRAAMNAKELSAFDATAWSKVAKWADDKAPAAADTDGKVVLICTWKHYHPVSKRAMESAARLAERHADKGLVVIAVHDGQDWDGARKAATLSGDAPKSTAFFVGFDEKGEFRKAIGSDGDPDFYFIDRAGQLRFADISTDVVDRAADLLLAESSDLASGVKGRLADEAEKRRREEAKTTSARTETDMLRLPALPPGFTAPTPDQYVSAKLPWHVVSADQSVPDLQDKTPPAISLPDAGWIGQKPELQGRVWVLYFWSFDDHRTYAAMPRMDQLQKARGRDVAVVGVLTFFADPNNSSETRQPDLNDLQRRVAEFTRNKSLQHSTLIEASGQLVTTTRGADSYGGLPLPYAVICSSDGTVRYSGPTTHPWFESTLENTIRLDPGVKARRKADDEYLKSKGK